jgi:nicotinamide riboside transporter PnuC
MFGVLINSCLSNTHQSSGWISDVDPYGWFQWYCRFYRGRRSSDDARQISRWKALAGTKGRFKSQLCNKILQKASILSLASATSKQNQTAMMTAINDVSISPVVRQTLFHWGLVITEEVMEQHERSQKR